MAERGFVGICEYTPSLLAERIERIEVESGPVEINAVFETNLRDEQQFCAIVSYPIKSSRTKARKD